MTKDGWHVVYGQRVFVVDGRVRRGLSTDGQRAVYPYEATNGGFNRIYSITLEALRARVARGTAFWF